MMTFPKMTRLGKLLAIENKKDKKMFDVFLK